MLGGEAAVRSERRKAHVTMLAMVTDGQYHNIHMSRHAPSALRCIHSRYEDPANGIAIPRLWSLDRVWRTGQARYPMRGVW